jgi:uncharacterized spore protein YtfJ
MNTEQILAGAQETLTARRVFGEPIQADGATILPVAVVRGGGGVGARSAEQGGAGFGVNARPAGIYVIRNGDAHWRPAVDINRIVLGGQLVAITALLTLRTLVVAWARRRAIA